MKSWALSNGPVRQPTGTPPPLPNCAKCGHTSSMPSEVAVGSVVVTHFRSGGVVCPLAQNASPMSWLQRSLVGHLPGRVHLPFMHGDPGAQSAFELHVALVHTCV